MELKKNPEVDLKQNKGLYFSIGLVVSLAIVTLAFEWKSYEQRHVVQLTGDSQNFEEVMDVPPTEQPPPEPPKMKNPEIVEVPDETLIEEDIELDLDIDMSEETRIEEQPILPEDAPEEEKTEEIFNIVEEKPTPKGGMKSFYEYVGEELKYPSEAARNNVEGKVFLQFVVNENGDLTNIEVVKGIGFGCDKEAIRVLKNAPKWNPGKQRGRAVKVRMVLPITFQLK